MSIDGILSINKPEGMTSFGVVARLKCLTGEKHIGHAGTLDPIATGVLPICFGRGTRVTQFIMHSSKTYLAEIELGTATDTFDREGTITHRGDPATTTKTQVKKTLASFYGTIQQVPPAYSALRHQGKRCYELARAGVPIQLTPRQVHISNIELIDYKMPVVTIKVECSKGTYIRSLAHDLGQKLGCYANLRNLTRVRYGDFCLEGALSIAQFEEAVDQGTWQDHLYPIDSPLLNFKAAIVDKNGEWAISNGQSLQLEEKHLSSDEYCRAYNQEGQLIAILKFIADHNLWHPEKVFRLCNFSDPEHGESLTANI
jgi:tRNA pseudouridine55 synthase